MNVPIIITSGKKYIDIDAYASMFAYKSLLDNLGYDVYVFSNAILNESISPLIKDMNFKFDEIDLSKEYKYIILDVSNPDFIDEFVEKNNIIEIIDHHTGYEEYWQNLGIKSQIEFIGSICTIIYERIKELKKEEILTPEICKLLIAGILDNTLNLKSYITSPRDILAYHELHKIGNIDSNWSDRYFHSCYDDLENNLEEKIINDIKIEDISILLPKVFGQLIVFDKNTIIDNIELIKKILSIYDEWIFNVISLDDGKSYIFLSDLNKFSELKNILGAKDENNYLVCDCILRKEIMKKVRDFSNEK